MLRFACLTTHLQHEVLQKDGIRRLVRCDGSEFGPRFRDQVVQDLLAGREQLEPVLVNLI